MDPRGDNTAYDDSENILWYFQRLFLMLYYGAELTKKSALFQTVP